jgi:hypothetical protein
MDIIYPSSCFYLRHNILENVFWPRFQVEPTQLDPIDRASSFHLKTEIESSLRNVMF